MSTFAVFGMTRAAALEIARAKTPSLVVKAKQIVTDANGKPVYSKRGKKPKKAWLPYCGKAA